MRTELSTNANHRGLERLLLRGQKSGAYPSAAAWIAHDGHVLGEAAVGPGPTTLETRFDVASLTKPMVVATLAMRAVSEGSVSLSDTVGSDLPRHVTVEALLGHRAGLPPWKDLVAALPEPRLPGHEMTRYALDALVRQAARESDPGRGAEYSDLGYMLLGRWLEARLGAGLDALVPARRGYRTRRTSDASVCATTGFCPWRQRVLSGEVHDPNAWVYGGVAGHAGVFATAAEVGRWALGLETLAFTGAPLPARVASASGLVGVDPGVVRDFWDPRVAALRPSASDPQRAFSAKTSATWVLGWDTPSPTGSSGGTRIAPEAVGHLGFTGTSVWIDRSARLVTVLLTNRVALGAAAQARLKAFRPMFHDAVRDLAGVS